MRDLNQEWYKTWAILHEVVDQIKVIEGIHYVTLRRSQKNVPYINFGIVYKDGKSKVHHFCNISWFGGVKDEREWRGLKLFFQVPSTKQRKVKFAAMDYDRFKVWEKGDPDPRNAIRKCIQELAYYVYQFASNPIARANPAFLETDFDKRCREWEEKQKNEEGHTETSNSEDP